MVEQKSLTNWITIAILFIPPQIPPESAGIRKFRRNPQELTGIPGFRRNSPESTGICTNLETSYKRYNTIPLGITYVRAVHHFQCFSLTYLLVDLI